MKVIFHTGQYGRHVKCGQKVASDNVPHCEGETGYRNPEAGRRHPYAARTVESAVWRTLTPLNEEEMSILNSSEVVLVSANLQGGNVLAWSLACNGLTVLFGGVVGLTLSSLCFWVFAVLPLLSLTRRFWNQNLI